MGQLSDFVRYTDSAYGYVSRPDIKSPRRVNYLNRRQRVIIIRQRLSHSHHNHIIYTTIRRQLRFRMEHLFHYLRGFQRPLQSFQPRCAKTTSHRTAYLAGHTNRMTLTAAQ